MWFNKDIKYIHHLTKFNKDIKYIHHLTKFESDRYKILTIEEINNIYNCNISKFSYMSVIEDKF